MGVSLAEELEEQMKRFLQQGANRQWVEGGKTGVVGVVNFSKPGPTVAFRFDMDANDVIEAEVEGHRPYREGRCPSVNKGAMHACGHDGHTDFFVSFDPMRRTISHVLFGVNL